MRAFALAVLLLLPCVLPAQTADARIRAQREVSELKLRVGYDGDSDLTDLANRVAQAVEKAIGLRPTIELMPNTEIVKFGPPHKIPRTSRQ